MSNCPVCGAPTDKVLTDRLRRGMGVVYYCESCDLGYLVKTWRDEKDYYAKDYRDSVSHKAGGSATRAAEIFDVYSRYQKSRVDAVLPHLKPSTSILEIGASAGQFLAHITAARRCAIEPDAECCELMEHAGIETDTAFLRDSRFYRQRFDIVCAFQVMEHAENPVAFLKDIRAVLNPGGVAFVEVPNLYDPLRSVWSISEYEPFYFHGDHLFYFSMDALLAVAHKAGFTAPQIRFTQDYNLLNHLHWIMTRSPQPDCHIGLSPVKLTGADSGMASWLSHKLAALNDEYVSMLESSGETSNIMAILTK